MVPDLCHRGLTLTQSLPRVRFMMRRMVAAVAVVSVIFEAARACMSKRHYRENVGELLAAVMFVALLLSGFDVARRTPKGHRPSDPGASDPPGPGRGGPCRRDTTI